MLKIATYDSATGEKGKGLLSIFARTQSKTIKEQYIIIWNHGKNDVW